MEAQWCAEAASAPPSGNTDRAMTCRTLGTFKIIFTFTHMVHLLALAFFQSDGPQNVNIATRRFRKTQQNKKPVKNYSKFVYKYFTNVYKHLTFRNSIWRPICCNIRQNFIKLVYRAVFYCCISREIIKKIWNIFNFFRRKLSETNQIGSVIKRHTSNTTSDYEWLRVTTS